MAKVIILVRTSTTKQEVETQKKELLEYAKSDCYSKDDIIIIEGVGASAIKLNDVYLNEMQELYHTIENNPIETIYAWEISRIGRNEEILMRFKNYLIERKIQLVIKNPSLRLLNSDGSVNNGVELAFSLFATMAVQEMKIKKERFHRAKERNKAEGKYNGGNIKLGYTLDKTNHFIIDEDKAKIVRDIFDWYIDGDSFRKIFERLVNMGVYKSTLNFRTGGKRIGDLLKDKAYIGANNYPSIVTKELFNKAQELITNVHKTHSSKNIFFCKRLIKDTVTGATLCAKSSTIQYYVRHKVHSMSLNINAMDFIALKSADYFIACFNAIQAQKNVQTYKITIEENKRLREAKKRQIEAYLDTIDRAIQMNIAQPRYFPKEKLDETISKNEKQIEKLRNEIVDLETQINQMQNWLNGNQQFINTIYEYSDEKKRDIIKDVVERIEVTEIAKCNFKIIVRSNAIINRTAEWEYKTQGNQMKIYQIKPINMDFTDKVIKRFKRTRYGQ